MCKFQAKDTGRTIGVAKEHHRLYILQGENTYPKERQLQAAYSASNQSTIWLEHLRLGHPPFSLLKGVFPALFKTLDPSVF